MATFRARGFGEYAQAMWRHRTLIVLMSIVMLTAALLIVRGLPDIYESKATVVVAAQHNERQAVVARVAAATERATSKSFLESVIKNHNLQPGVDGAALEPAVQRMRKQIKIDTSWRSDYPERITISYKNSDPRVAKEIAADLIGVFTSMNQSMEKQKAEEASAVETRIAEVENRLRDLGQQRMVSAVRRSAASQAQGAVYATRAQRAAAAASLETLSDRQYALERQIDEQRRLVSEQQKIAKTAPSDARSSSSYGVLLVKKAELEAQLKDYSAQYTDKNPKVHQANNQLTEINRQITQLNTGGGPEAVAINSPEARELRSLQRELSKMETELEVTRREIGRKNRLAPNGATYASTAIGSPLPSPAGSGLDHETDLERLRAQYTSLLRRQDELQREIAASAGLEPGLFQVVDPPAEPALPVGPNRPKLQVLAFLLSLGFGLVVGAAFEVPRLFQVRDERDVEYYLGRPVLALIPEVTTASEEGRARRLMMTRWLGLLLLAGILVPALVVILNQFRVFQLLADKF